MGKFELGKGWWAKVHGDGTITIFHEDRRADAVFLDLEAVETLKAAFNHKEH